MEVQKIWRCRLGCLQFAMEREVMERNSIVIQSIWRMHHFFQNPGVVSTWQTW